MFRYATVLADCASKIAMESKDGSHQEIPSNEPDIIVIVVLPDGTSQTNILLLC